MLEDQKRPEREKQNKVDRLVSGTWNHYYHYYFTNAILLLLLVLLYTKCYSVILCIPWVATLITNIISQYIILLYYIVMQITQNSSKLHCALSNCIPVQRVFKVPLACGCSALANTTVVKWR